MKSQHFASFALLTVMLFGPSPAMQAADAPAKTTAKADAKPADSAKKEVDTSSIYQASSYVLHPADSISVDVVDDPKASHEYKIALDGTVRVTYLETPIKLAGLTVNDAVKTLEKAYVEHKIFIKPQITIAVAGYAARRLYVNGQVGHPGWVEIPPEQQLTVKSAVTQAGSFTSKADSEATVSRTGPDGKPMSFKVDLRGIIKGTAQDVPLQDGDTIFIGESVFGDLYH